MKKLSVLLVIMLTIPTAMAECVDGVWGGPWAGPSPTPPTCVGEAAPVELCFLAGCSPVSYTQDGSFVWADSTLPNGYPVRGFSGPCLEGEACTEAKTQAFAQLFWNARQANRAQRYEP